MGFIYSQIPTTLTLGASEIVLADIEASTKCGSSIVEVWKLDLSSFSSVQALASRAPCLDRIDVLCENAAMVAYTYSCAEGHEQTITVNVIRTFFLGLLLLPKLHSTAGDFKTTAHLTIVSSDVHAYARFLEFKEPAIFETPDESYVHGMSDCYRTSKLLVILVFRRIAPKIAGSGVILNPLGPGLCHSELFRSAGSLAAALKFVFARTAEVGSRTLGAAAVVGQESHGKYVVDGKVDDDALSSFVRSEDGGSLGERIWAELSTILEEIQPGVTKNL
ncbi:hypothetical protein V8C42DRAFT_350932 [Trichoderma barbatum]